MRTYLKLVRWLARPFCRAVVVAKDEYRQQVRWMSYHRAVGHDYESFFHGR